MSSIDLSAAFDVVNVSLLLKRLRIVGLPSDVVALIECWLRTRYCYVNVDDNCSNFFISKAGTVQGSILGPFLYAIYVSPLFDLSDLTNFADDNFVLRWNSSIEALIEDMRLSLEAIVKWLRDSGLKVNESKTEICLFHRLDSNPISISVCGTLITSKPSMNVLGVIFDSKLQWSPHVAQAITKARKALHAIKLIKKYFNLSELKTLLTSNFYSILYYNSEIWHIPKLKPCLKNKLKSASANALKLITRNYDRMMSFNDLHSVNNRALPDQMLKYKHALLLFNIYNNEVPHFEWLALNIDQIFTSRSNKFQVLTVINYKVGSNILTHRLSVINNQIPLSWLNLSKETFKIKCKELFLKARAG